MEGGLGRMEGGWDRMDGGRRATPKAAVELSLKNVRRFNTFEMVIPLAPRLALEERRFFDDSSSRWVIHNPQDPFHNPQDPF